MLSCIEGICVFLGYRILKNIKCKITNINILSQHSVLLLDINVVVHSSLFSIYCRSLIKLVKTSTSERSRQCAVEVAISLFYHLSSLVSEDTKYYPPTRQFFSACIEMLGQVTIFSTTLLHESACMSVLSLTNIL